MRARVYGVIEGDPVTVLERTVSIKTLYEEWGPYAMAVFHARKDRPLIVGTRRVWIEIVP